MLATAFSLILRILSNPIGNVGYALALFQLSTLVSIILGYRIFKEQNIKKKLLGAIIMVIGFGVIILLN